MIEGIKITIQGSELAQLCRNQALHHRRRVEFWEKQLRDECAAPIDVMASLSGVDQKRVAGRKISEHRFHATELEFIAEHLENSETYQLTRSDFGFLGLAAHEGY